MIKREEFTENERRIINAAVAMGFKRSHDHVFLCTDEALVNFAMTVAQQTFQQLFDRLPTQGNA